MIQLRDGTPIALDDAGHGTPVVFLHGFPHARGLWASQLAALAGRFRAIAPDLRGFGESRSPGPFSMDRWADDVAELLDALGIARAVLCGISMGGYVALAAWRRHPARILGLVLCDTRAGPDGDEARAKRDAMIALAREKGVGAVADAMLPGMIGKTTRERNPALTESMRTMMTAAPLDGVVGALAAMRDREDSTSTLATIDVPTLVVVGEEDALTPPSEARAMHASIAGSRLEVIAGAGHASPLERPSAFNQALAEFVASLEAARN